MLGECNPDLVLHGGHVEPVFGQVERLVDTAELTIGGSAGITACGAARLGLRTALVAVAGDDAFGRFMLGALGERGVDVSGVVVDPGVATGVSVVLVRGEDRAILTALGAIASLDAVRVDRDIVLSARHVHVSSFFLQDALRPALPALFRDVRAAGAATSVDPNWDPAETWDGGLFTTLAETSVLFVNAEEARRISGAGDVEEAALLLARHAPTVVVKCGADGALAVQGDSVVHAPARPVDFVDAVGAGDSFDAGFIAGLLDGRPLPEALALANACGSLSMRAAGGTAAQPTLAEALAA